MYRGSGRHLKVGGGGQMIVHGVWKNGFHCISNGTGARCPE